MFSPSLLLLFNSAQRFKTLLEGEKNKNKKCLLICAKRVLDVIFQFFSIILRKFFNERFYELPINRKGISCSFIECKLNFFTKRLHGLLEQK